MLTIVNIWSGAQIFELAFKRAENLSEHCFDLTVKMGWLLNYILTLLKFKKVKFFRYITEKN
jgi:hypothetical protein